MFAALTQAEQGVTMFGAVLVYEGEVVAEAYNTVSQTNDPSAHAELNLIRGYCQKAETTNLFGFTLYTTAEPCPMCAALCAFSGVSKVVFGVSITQLADLGVPQLELSCKEILDRGARTVSVRGGVLRKECLAHCKALAEKNS